MVDGKPTEVVLAIDYDKLEQLCVDFTRAIGEALIATNERSAIAEDQSMDNVTKVWAVEIALIDGTWEIAETDDHLELFAHEGQAREALCEYLNGSDGNEENFRLVCFTRDAVEEDDFCGERPDLGSVSATGVAPTGSANDGEADGR